MSESDINVEDLLAALQQRDGYQQGASGSQVDMIAAIVQQFKPEVNKGFDLIDELWEEFGPKILEYAEAIRNKFVEDDIKSLKQYKDADIEEHTAYLLIRDRANRMQESSLQFKK